MKKFFPAKAAAMVCAAALFATQANMSYAAVSDDGIPDVKKQVEDAIAMPLDMQKSTGMGLAMGGPVEVKANGDFYEVKLPSVTYQLEGMKADFGTITMNVTPSGDQYKMTMALPSTVTVYDAAKTPVAEVKFGDQQFSSVWLPKYRSFTNIDAEYKDISINSTKAGEKVAINISGFKTILDLKQESGDVWSGPATFEVNGLHLKGGDNAEFDMSIDSVKGDASYSKLNMQVRKDVEDKTDQALQKNMPKDPKPDPAQMQSMMTSVVNSLQNYIDGMGSNFKISGITLKVMPGPATGQATPPKPIDIRLGSVSWGFDLAGLQQEKGNISVKFGMDGLNVSDMDPGTASIVPTASNLEIHLDNLPFQELSKGLSNVFSQVVSSAMATQTVTDPAQKTALQNQTQAQVAAAMASIPQTLQTAGSKLSIVNTFAKAPDVGTTLDGSFTANSASPVMAQGSITLLITGLDELVVKLQTLAQGPNADMKLLNWAQGLGMVQLMGQLGKAPDGRSQRTFKLEVSPDGKVMLNGADFGSSLGAMGIGRGVGGTPPSPKTP
jgi:hypothetical protein